MILFRTAERVMHEIGNADTAPRSVVDRLWQSYRAICRWTTNTADFAARTYMYVCAPRSGFLDAETYPRSIPS